MEPKSYHFWKIRNYTNNIGGICLAVWPCSFLRPHYIGGQPCSLATEDRHHPNSFMCWWVGWIICSFIYFIPPGHEGHPSPRIFLAFILFFLDPQAFLLRASLALRSPLESPKSQPHCTFNTQLKSHVFHKIVRINWFWIYSWLCYWLVVELRATHSACLGLSLFTRK